MEFSSGIYPFSKCSANTVDSNAGTYEGHAWYNLYTEDPFEAQKPIIISMEFHFTSEKRTTSIL